MLVEKIAVCWWRQKRALHCEAGMVRKQFADAFQKELVHLVEIADEQAKRDGHYDTERSLHELLNKSEERNDNRNDNNEVEDCDEMDK